MVRVSAGGGGHCFSLCRVARQKVERGGGLGFIPDDEARPFDDLEVGDSGEIQRDDRKSRGHRFEDRPVTLVRSRRGEEKRVHRSIHGRELRLLIPGAEISIGHAQRPRELPESIPRFSLSHVEENDIWIS